MAALPTTPDSPAAQLERTEAGSECDPEQDGEEEEAKGQEMEAAMEEEAEDLAEELEAEGARAGPAEQAEQDDDVAEVVAEERSPVLGTQERLGLGRGGGDTESPALREKGKRKELALGEDVSRAWGRRPGRALGPDRVGLEVSRWGSGRAR